MRFLVADRSLEPQLRALVHRITVPGHIEISYRREPDFFDALAVEGETCQVLALLDGDRIVGTGCRAVRPLYINGKPMDFGYLGGLRLVPEVRRTTALGRGYAFLHRLHGDGRVPAYITTIIEDNAPARMLLTRNRGGLPHYEDLGRILTWVRPLKRRPRPPALPAGCRIVSGREIGLDPVLEFVNKAAERRQFAPVWRVRGFGSGLTRGLSPASFRVLVKDGHHILAVTALWDQRAFRGTVVAGYHGVFRTLLPLTNTALKWAGYDRLPQPGSRLEGVYAAMLTAEQDDPALMRLLIDAVSAECATLDIQHLILGFHEQDPLSACTKGCRAIRYASRLYGVYWDDAAGFFATLDRSRVPHAEVATL